MTRDEEINRLRREEGMRLQDIGDLYGLTRERVRQICGNTGYLFSRVRREKIRTASPHTTTQELSDLHGLSYHRVSTYREGWHTIAGDTNPALGNAWEGWTADLLNSLGHETELQPYGAPFDILVDRRLRIDVKVSSRASIPPSQKGKLVNGWHNFSVRKFENREPIDFYILITADTEDVFVVPDRAIKMGCHNIKFCWPSLRPTLGKYQKYLNRFDLLQGE